MMNHGGVSKKDIAQGFSVFRTVCVKLQRRFDMKIQEELRSALPRSARLIPAIALAAVLLGSALWAQTQTCEAPGNLVVPGDLIVQGNVGNAIASGRNRFANPSFEHGTSPWGAYSWGQGTITLTSVADETAPHGRKVLQIDCANIPVGYPCGIYQGPFTLKGNTNYAVEYRVKCTAGRSIALTASNIGGWTPVVNPQCNGGWQTQIVRHLDSVDRSDGIYLGDFGGGTFTYWVDAAQFEEGATPTGFSTVNRNSELELSGLTIPTGSVGIGTTSPIYAFDVVGNPSAGPLGRFYSTDTVDGRSVVSFQSAFGTGQVFHLGIGASGGANLDFAIRDISASSTPTRFIIKSGTGNVGIGTTTPSYPLQMGSGAYCSAGGVWTNASSREYKQDIRDLSTEQAVDTLEKLDPVTFSYKASPAEHHVGFIAEDVPDLLATQDHKGLSAMDVVAVLTKVVQQQQEEIRELKRQLATLRAGSTRQAEGTEGGSK